MKIRRKRRQSPTPSVMALEAQSVKWGNRQNDNGFDANTSPASALSKYQGHLANPIIDSII
jgi:hypothetical protein